MHKCSNTTLQSRVKPFLQNHGFCGNFYLAVLQVLFWGISPIFWSCPKMAGHHALTLSPFVFARKSKISPPTPRNLPTIQNELLKEHVSGQTELDIS